MIDLIYIPQSDRQKTYYKSEDPDSIISAIVDFIEKGLLK